MTRMTFEEAKSRITPEIMSQAIKASKREPDMTDPDAPDISELLKKGLVKRVNKRVGTKAVTPKKNNIRLSGEVVAGLKKLGKNWQQTADEAMREWLTWRGLL